jgi:hypothetical protein
MYYIDLVRVVRVNLTGWDDRHETRTRRETERERKVNGPSPRAKTSELRGHHLRPADILSSTFV